MVNYPYVVTIDNKDDFELKDKIHLYHRFSFMGVHKVEQINDTLHIYLSIPESSVIKNKNNFITRKIPTLTNKITKFVFYITHKLNIKLLENTKHLINKNYFFMIFDTPDTLKKSEKSESILSTLDEYMSNDSRKRGRSSSRDRRDSYKRERESRDRRRSRSRDYESRDRKRSRSRERDSRDYENSRRYYGRSHSPERKSRRESLPERSDNKPSYEDYYRQQHQQIPYGYQVPYTPYGNQVPYENPVFNSSYGQNYGESYSQNYGENYPSIHLPHPPFPSNIQFY